ncbi:nuclear transport factor 2 family protein [Nocardia arthritidis]|uniref:Nuclear transport factor 2 family protein n=2 Tax=Nocardia arthritidis TaxID=228602 RepID=A0A6G9YIN5_9NOCA|nr:nuclear transport factor 2 family protein [Nocardia arthritidis]
MTYMPLPETLSDQVQTIPGTGPNAPSDNRQQSIGKGLIVAGMTVSSVSPARLVLEGMYRAEAEYLAAGGPGMASFSTLAPFFAPEVVLWQADSLPYGGAWRGHEGMERFFLAMSATWERFELIEQAFLSEGDPLVVLTHVRARSRVSGRELNFPILQTITVVDGRITEVRPFYWDTAIIAEACSSSVSEDRP